MISAAAQAEHLLGFRFHRQNQVMEAEPCYRKALMLAPDFKEAWMNLGLLALTQRRPAEALECQREALRIDPESPDAHNNLGMAHYAQGHIAEAENCFRAALRLDPRHANATLNLGSARQTLNHVQEAEALFRHAAHLGADPARVGSNLSLALLEQGRPADAEQVLRTVLSGRPDHPEATANLALALLTQGKLKEGWPAYEARWSVEGLRAPALSAPRWTGQVLAGKTILLYAEQGFGDTLQFCRYAPMVAAAGGRVVLAVPRPLRRLMATLGGVSELLADDSEVAPAFDFQCPLLSLPLAFGTCLETIPATASYLSGDPVPWADVLRPLSGLKVGLVWAGKSRTEQPHAVAIDRRRSMRFADIAPLLHVPGCRFVSLQIGPSASQMDHPSMIDVSTRMSDWADTAGLVAGLDLVIAADTAVAHLAGALGKPVWLLNRYDSCWRWFLERDDTPWYPSMRLYRQNQPGDWAGVIAHVARDLRAVAASD